jgi:hypothetical protein
MPLIQMPSEAPRVFVVDPSDRLGATLQQNVPSGTTETNPGPWVQMLPAQPASIVIWLVSVWSHQPGSIVCQVEIGAGAAREQRRIHSLPWVVSGSSLGVVEPGLNDVGLVLGLPPGELIWARVNAQITGTINVGIGLAYANLEAIS